MKQRQRMVIGISGATGIVFGIRALQMLRELHIETHLVVTKPGQLTRAYETDYSETDLKGLADYSYSPNDIGAVLSSGSFHTLGMLIAPCSVNTLSEIAYGTTSNLLTRAADVTLKERRRLVLLFREAPLHAGHLKSMLAVTKAGGILVPPVPAFYIRPRSIDDLVDHTIGRVLDLFGMSHPRTQRWTGMARNNEEHAPLQVEA